MNTHNLENVLSRITRRLQEDNADQLLIRTFCERFKVFAQGRESYIREDAISPATALPAFSDLDTGNIEPDLFSRVAIVKLNGGLGTSMGLSKAKSLLPVKDGLSFLEIILHQMQNLHTRTGHRIPVLFMNSFSTEEDTLEVINRFPALKQAQTLPFSFLQNRVPKLAQSDWTPVDFPADPELTWCPPGHGDFYTCLVSTGLLDKLIEQGIQYVFISNADNLGATLDPAVLNYFATRDLPFMMEVTRRTEADKKGGHLAVDSEGRLLLRESAQCHPDETDAFQDIQKHRYFNTNNLWINLRHLADLLKQHDNMLPLPVIANSKTVDPRDKNSQPVIQLETAMGAAIGLFDNAAALDVPRTRFAPVKTTSDLLALWSDIFLLDDAYHVVPNPRRTLGTIDITLVPEHYKLLDAFRQRFKHGAPSLIQCKTLDIQGDYTFDKDVTLKGHVTLPPTQQPQIIAKDTVLQESGEL
jgi:UTP--glucose-1-phosphate uridylyltransferase